ncbi:MAG: hypothetical protein JWO91_1697 [Acidobacteriaceae bacterium]|nr:hypothetical protein [Acidobacteriaceae bacterium]
MTDHLDQWEWPISRMVMTFSVLNWLASRVPGTSNHNIKVRWGKGSYASTSARAFDISQTPA